ncbi:phospholipid phosphatase 2-like isoform X1 [Arapaima gigas]
MTDLRRKKLLVCMDVLCVFVAALPFMVMSLVYSPYEREIHCDDESIKYPYKEDTITHGLMAAVTICCTVTIICSGEAYLVYSKKIRSNSTFNQYVAALYKVVGTFLFGAAVSQSLTDLAKYTIGRPRPNFLAVCAPKICKGYVLQINCTGNRHRVVDSRYRWGGDYGSDQHVLTLQLHPILLSLYVQARLVAKWARLLRPTVQFFLVAFAVYVGYTRVSDYKHHWSDVLVGLLQGALIAILNVRYVSDFFKARPQCCSSPESPESEELEPKASLQIVDTERATSNHYSYPSST